MRPAPQVTEQEDQGDQWLQPPSCLTEGSKRKVRGQLSESKAMDHCGTLVHYDTQTTT